MSSERYRRLMSYEVEATKRALESLASVPEVAHAHPDAQRAHAVMAHIQIAREVWLHRLRGTPYKNPDAWFPQLQLAVVRMHAESNDAAWVAYLQGLTDADLGRQVVYTSSEGVKYANTVDDILTHVFNHSSYHRGQVATLVTRAGGSRASTDYIILSRKAL